MELDERVVKSAEVQHGVFTLSQARDHGASLKAVKHRLATGAWVSFPYVGVYRVAGSPPSWQQDLHALVLAAGPEAAASHRSAAALLGFPGFTRRCPLEVVTRRPLRERTPGARVHSSRLLPPEHLTVVEGIATTCVARTVLDLSGVLHPRRTERVLDNCLARKLATLDAIRTATDLLAKRGRPGIAVMRRLLATRDDDYVPPESSLEARAIELIRSTGLPDPVCQLDIGDDDGWIGRVDLAYSDRRLVIEVDSDLHHSTVVDRQADRIRDGRLSAAGWRVERITGAELDRPAALADRLRTILEFTTS